MPTRVQKITTFLWYNDNAEEAARFYTSIFANSRITSTTRYGPAAAKGANRPEGSIMTVVFELEGQEFVAMNGGPAFSFNPAISLMVNCETQAEIDDLWGKLTAGGAEVQCGWLTDKFGLSWQIVPTVMWTMMLDKDPVKVENAMKAMLGMVKLDIAGLERAFASKEPLP